MNSDFFGGLFSIAIAIVGVAWLAVLVSKNANTAGILSAGAHGLGGALTAAEGPVLGGNVGLDSSHYGPNFYG